MKLMRGEFLSQAKKSITIIGMSGLGKTHLSSMLAQEGWTHYSCDEVIGRDYLAAKLDAPLTKEDLSPLSRFIGKVGDTAKGGLTLDEFKRRQKLYYDAECAALRRVGSECAASAGDFVNDSTGSLCEIGDGALLDQVGGQTLFVYIRADPEDEKKIFQRAADYPKPMFFPPDKFDGWLDEYRQQHLVHSVDEVDPNAFARWVFPVLFRERLPKYQKLADAYGVTIPSATIAKVKNADAFVDVVARALPHDR